MKNKSYCHTIYFILLAMLCCSLFLSCNNQQQRIEGCWENESKILKFSDGLFYIYNKNNSELVAFSGRYEFAVNPAYAIKMSYQKYMDSSKSWNSLKDTQLENYTEVNLFRVTDDTLELKIIGNDQFYVYNRVENFPF